MDSDLKESKELVERLAVPESTKNFVFAIKVPEHDSTIYLLSVHNLSQRSATDAECLIRELRPDAVVTQVNPSAYGAAEEEIVLEEGSTGSIIPTSVFEVLTRCVSDKSHTKRKYKRVAGNLVMEEIFGIGFNKHLLTVEKVAGDVGSTYVVLDSPFVMKSLKKTLTGQAYHQGSALINDQQALMQRVLSCQLSKGNKESNRRAPRFARSTYYILVHIHNTLFDDLPAIRKALQSAKKIFYDVYKGESIDTEKLNEVYLFRDAVECLRTASNNAGRIPIKNPGTQVQFSKLSFTDKAYALMADELRSQAKKFKTIVAVVDACNLEGLRRHWRTCVPQQVKDMSTEHRVQQGFDSNDDSGGALTLSKAFFASPMFKISTIKAPLNPFLTHKAMPFAFTRVAYPSTVMAPWFASSGAQPLSWEKPSFLSTRKIIRAVTKFGLSSAQSTSFSAMRAAFYTMKMRKQLAKPVGALPRVVFGASLVICCGLLVYKRGIERAALALPSASSIAKLGRGIQNLREASLEVTRRGNNRVQNNTREGFITQRLRKNWTLNVNFKTSFGS